MQSHIMFLSTTTRPRSRRVNSVSVRISSKVTHAEHGIHRTPSTDSVEEGWPGCLSNGWPELPNTTPTSCPCLASSTHQHRHSKPLVPYHGCPESSKLLEVCKGHDAQFGRAERQGHSGWVPPQALTALALRPLVTDRLWTTPQRDPQQLQRLQLSRRQSCSLPRCCSAAMWVQELELRFR